MKRIQEIWPEFIPDEEMSKNYTFRDAWEAPMTLHGLAPNDEHIYCRLPLGLGERVNPGVEVRCFQTSGVCLRFRTDAPSVCIAAALSGMAMLHHMTVTAQSGCELYQENDDGTYREILPVRPEIRPGAVGIYPFYQKRIPNLPGEGMRGYCLYLPSHNGMKKLLVGLPHGAKLEAPRKRRVEKPIVFYGSSITQGTGASKSSVNYPNILSRRLDAIIYNLGFSGSAHGEETITDYIKQLDMSVFVYDYDHNAPSPEALMNTHEKMFRAIRAAQPDLPIVMITRPDSDDDPKDALRRLAVVRRTYENALAAGDKKVWFVDGSRLFGDTDRDACTVDNCHPNTLGYMRMADGIEPAVREALQSIGL